MKKILKKINGTHVNYNVLWAAVLQMPEAEQTTLNAAITKALGLHPRASSAAIQRKREIMVDDLDDYDVILDVFKMLKKLTKELTVGGVGFKNETLAEAQMLIGSIEDDND